MELVLEHSKTVNKMQKEIQELNEVIHALRQGRVGLEEV